VYVECDDERSRAAAQAKMITIDNITRRRRMSRLNIWSYARVRPAGVRSVMRGMLLTILDTDAPLRGVAGEWRQ